ncbi:hypothetical protein VNO78_07293 [Psophocarpus tetragonolobus]|uniref:Uncharacterized protein n=1 Tax=Psophocarpus tetragonolobus TaxID=3891 RepID=A0AAN9T2W1_PSOTE
MVSISCMLKRCVSIFGDNRVMKSLHFPNKMQDVKNVVVHNISPGMVTTDLLMSGVSTKQAKYLINVLAEPAEVVIIGMSIEGQISGAHVLIFLQHALNFHNMHGLAFQSCLELNACFSFALQVGIRCKKEPIHS